MITTQGKAIVLIAIWLTGVVFSFWWYEARYYQAFSGTVQESIAQFSVEDSSLAGTGQFSFDEKKEEKAEDQITVINVIDPNCPCSQYSLPHISEIQQQYAAEGVRFLVLSKVESNDVNAMGMNMVSQHTEALLSQFVKVSPAVLILDQQSNPAYFGPYSAGAICGEGKSFVVDVLDSLQDGNNPSLLENSSIGCFCDWV